MKHSDELTDKVNGEVAVNTIASISDVKHSQNHKLTFMMDVGQKSALEQKSKLKKLMNMVGDQQLFHIIFQVCIYLKLSVISMLS